jgi:hypothetical protein
MKDYWTEDEYESMGPYAEDVLQRPMITLGDDA